MTVNISDLIRKSANLGKFNKGKNILPLLNLPNKHGWSATGASSGISWSKCKLSKIFFEAVKK